jgi:hypothetical protein
MLHIALSFFPSKSETMQQRGRIAKKANGNQEL